MRGACIDIGSNTTRLLVADVEGGKLREVDHERVFTPLARAVATGRPLAHDLIADVAQVVASQERRARERGAESVRVLGTAAIRRAPNGYALAAAVAEGAGRPVEVLSPREESELAFLGATAAPEGGCRTGETVGVIDVGGGSTELIAGCPGESPSWYGSPGLGSADVAARWFAGDPPSGAEVDAAREGVRAAFAALGAPSVDRALAVGGGATSLVRVAGAELGPGSLRAGLAELLAGPAAQVASRMGLDARRVALLPAAIVLLEAGSTAFGATLLAVRGGVREGALLQAEPHESRAKR